ncbi:MAG: TlpA family protein disulfide reductase [Deltaproteobacteria bacterium]|nr:TlpA family protein disulfide reductase [Deltaproteobacteria bacterium]
MKNKIVLFMAAMIMAVSFFTGPAKADLAVGQRFHDLTFSGTLSAADRDYLGLVQPGPFKLKDIQARYVLLNIFSDSCPHCILAAPGVNRLFGLITQNRKLRSGDGLPQLKMLGVGFYGTPVQMEVWRIKREVRFPLIPDPKAQIGKALDIPGTPTYVVLDRQGLIVYVHAGEMGNPKAFLRKIIDSLE